VFSTDQSNGPLLEQSVLSCFVNACAFEEKTMTTPIRLWTGMLAAAVLSAPTAYVTQARTTDQTTPNAQRVADGSYLFRTYCAPCHGVSGRGDGPLADSLRRRPANLTEIRKRNNDVFPEQLVFRVIDGREKVRGHGGPDMPVWGDAFLRSIEGGDEETVKRRIQALVEYLATIQSRDGQ
jgi:mono/diheme cytochrome c family protein